VTFRHFLESDREAFDEFLRGQFDGELPTYDELLEYAWNRRKDCLMMEGRIRSLEHQHDWDTRRLREAWDDITRNLKKITALQAYVPPVFQQEIARRTFDEATRA